MSAAREERIEATFAGVPVSGVSVAGRETYFSLPSLGCAFDLGRTPSDLVPVSNIFLSHAHLDHAAGLPYWFSQRRLSRLPGGVVRTDPSAVDRWRRIVALHEELEGVRYDARVEAIAPGESVAIRRDLSVSAFRVDHRIPTLGFCVSQSFSHARPEFRGRSEAEIRMAARAGERVKETVWRPLIAFCGDTARGVFTLAPPEVWQAKVLLLECSFVEERDRGRSKDWGHLHLDEIAEHADLFQNEVLVLTHITLRTRPEEVRESIERGLPASLAKRTVAFLPGATGL
ncbi:MAG: MBL fold metallo-hydrolase [Thermoanaerobaculia bacterium]